MVVAGTQAQLGRDTEPEVRLIPRPKAVAVGTAGEELINGKSSHTLGIMGSSFGSSVYFFLLLLVCSFS